MLLFEEKIRENRDEFVNKVIDISKKLEIDPNALMSVMDFESRLDHRAYNQTSGATGLIQFIPSTASSLGTSTDELRNMTNVQQLDYVYKYLNQYKSKLVNWVDIYLAVFFPKAMAKSDDYVIQSNTLSADTIARQNPVFSQGKGAITVGDIKRVFLGRIPNKFVETFKKGFDTTEKFVRRNKFGILLAILGVVGLSTAAIILIKSKK